LMSSNTIQQIAAFANQCYLLLVEFTLLNNDRS
jgi:hypothetical protein